MLENFNDTNISKEKQIPMFQQDDRQKEFSVMSKGLGKYYAGYRGQAIATFLPSAIFGVVAAENLYRRGPKDVQFILFASIFSIFYTGNILGSDISVRTYREQQYNEIYNNIMLDLHIPLRRIFSE